MGLSASQARFLAVTARKANCEFRSLQLAQQRLSLTRELQKASEDYQDALDATRLVWDLDPDNQGAYMYDLSYDLLMQPSEYNKYTPYLVSRQDGKIAVNDKYVKAAQGIFNMVQDPETGIWSSDGGLIDENGNVVYRGDEGFAEVQQKCFDKFIDELKKNRGMSSSIANNMQYKDSSLDMKYIFIEDAGVGGELMGRESRNVMTFPSVLSYIDYLTENLANGYIEPGSEQAKLAEAMILDFGWQDYYDNEEELNKEGFINGVGSQPSPYHHGDESVPDVGSLRADLSCYLNDIWSAKSGATCLLKNGQYHSDPKYDVNGAADYSDKTVTLADLLNEDVTMMVTGQQSYSEILEVLSWMLNNASNMKDWTLINDDVDIWYDKVKAMMKQENPDVNSSGTYAELVKYARANKGLEILQNENLAPAERDQLVEYYLSHLLDEKKNSHSIAAMVINAMLADYKNKSEEDKQNFYNFHKDSMKSFFNDIVNDGKNHTNAQSSLALLNYFDKLAKGMYNLLMPDPDNPTVKDQNAFITALTNVVSRMRNVDGYDSVDKNYVTLSTVAGNSEAAAQNAVKNADAYNCWVKYGNAWALSLSNLTEGFLSEFMNGMDNYQDGCSIDKIAGTSSYITDDAGYLYTVNTTEKNAEALWESEFYSIIFNSMCSNGLYENQMLEEKGYFDNALKNGQLFIVSKNADNYYYQSRYTQAYGQHIRQEKDEQAIAIAEREYAYKKNKINYKEQQIEVETRSIDAELSALNTEFETVKSLINKNVDKTFKMFQSS